MNANHSVKDSDTYFTKITELELILNSFWKKTPERLWFMNKNWASEIYEQKLYEWNLNIVLCTCILKIFISKTGKISSDKFGEMLERKLCFHYVSRVLVFNALRFLNLYRGDPRLVLQVVPNLHLSQPTCMHACGPETTQREVTDEVAVVKLIKGSTLSAF